jgi:hypothetical protein
VLFKARNESCDICAGSGERCRIVEGVVAIASALAHLQGERRFSALPRSVDEDDRSVRERGDQGIFRQPASGLRGRYTPLVMSPLLLPFQLVLLMFAGWVNRHQLDVIEYLQKENRVLKELGGMLSYYHREAA